MARTYHKYSRGEYLGFNGLCSDQPHVEPLTVGAHFGVREKEGECMSILVACLHGRVHPAV